MRGCLVHQMLHVCCRLSFWIHRLGNAEREKPHSYRLTHRSSSCWLTPFGDIHEIAQRQKCRCCTESRSRRWTGFSANSQYSWDVNHTVDTECLKVCMHVCIPHPSAGLHLPFRSDNVYLCISMRGNLGFTVQAEQRTVALNLELLDENIATAKGEA